MLNRIGLLLVDGIQNAEHGLVRTAMQRTFQGADGRGDGGVHIRQSRSGNTSSKGGGVQFVIGVQD